MGESTAELTGDIEETRARLGTHLDELETKVSPSAVVDRRKQAAKSRLLGVREKALGTARSAGDGASGVGDRASDAASQAADTARDQYQGAPIAAGVAAFGLGMVIAALVPASRAEQRAAVQVKDTVADRAQPLVEDAKHAAAQVGEQVKESATESVQQVKETAQDSASTVADEGRSSAGTVRDQTSG
ncbi:DUF3618 domain-containing protein [Nocardioides litoris]|uniref:DUF3618 domain-containing protein n=1 Tax=Nocardioides litoris TaxID=1926648 RepID=UPI00111EDF01|nr:DUF3618 domain-containing protein [Nocardioides litoris]